MSDWKSERNHN